MVVGRGAVGRGGYKDDQAKRSHLTVMTLWFWQVRIRNQNLVSISSLTGKYAAQKFKTLFYHNGHIKKPK